MSTQQANDQSLRILASYKKIWGADKEFDLNLDCDDGRWGDCQCMVREDLGSSYGPTLTMTNVCNTPVSAWNELDRMLRLWARQVDSGRPMSREDALTIFSKPSGDHGFALEQFMRSQAQGGTNGVADPKLAELVAQAIAAGNTFID